MNQENTPLLTRLEALATGERLSFHMPANRGGRSFPEGLTQVFSHLETTELAVTDDLNRPEGPALEAETLAAEFFGAGASLFFTSGSTTAIYAMLTAAVGEGGRILADPCSHRSLAHIASLLDLEIEFLPMEKNTSLRSPIPKVDPVALEQVLDRAEGGRFQAVYLTSPDYYGNTADLDRIAKIARRHGLLILCDEAHGAAFAALPGVMPPSALAAGADMAVQSLHKTLPALAPASILHLSADLLERNSGIMAAAEKARPLYQTSSPSFPVAASIDYARKVLATEGAGLLRQLICRIGTLESELPKGTKILPASPGRDDPARVVIDCRESKKSALDIAADLGKRGIDVEMADFDRLVLIPSLDQPGGDFTRLCEALAAIIPAPGTTFHSTGNHDLQSQITSLLARSRKPVRPRFALMRGLREETLKLQDGLQALAQGKKLIAAACLSPYPPGIPLFYPGEEVKEDDLTLLASLLDKGIVIPGCAEGRLPILIQ